MVWFVQWNTKVRMLYTAAVHALRAIPPMQPSQRARGGAKSGDSALRS